MSNQLFAAEKKTAALSDGGDIAESAKRDLSKVRVTCFANAYATDPDGNATLEQLAADIRGEGTRGQQLAKATARVRRLLAEANGDKRNPAVDAAKKALPCFTASGRFTKRSKAHLTQHTGIIQADFDHVPDIAKLKALLASDPHVVMNPESCTGTGVKGFFHVRPPDTDDPAVLTAWHEKNAFPALTNYCQHTFGFRIDQQCVDASRLCFEGHDPDVRTNWNAKPLDVDAWLNDFRNWALDRGFTGDLRTLDLRKLLVDAGLADPADGDEDKYFVRCPWEDQHTTRGNGTDVVVFHDPDAKGFAHAWHCSHDHCHNKDVMDVIDYCEEKTPGCVDAACAKTYEPEATDPSFNDAGRADRFVARYGRDLRFVPEREVWLTWERDRWRLDTDGAVERFALAMTKAMLVAAADIKGTDDAAVRARNAAVKEALACGDRRNIADFVHLARVNPLVLLPVDQLDADPWVVGALAPTRERTSLREHSRVTWTPARLVHAGSNSWKKCSPTKKSGTSSTRRWAIR